MTKQTYTEGKQETDSTAQTSEQEGIEERRAAIKWYFDRAAAQDAELERRIQAGKSAAREKAFRGCTLSIDEVELLGGADETVLVLDKHGCKLRKVGQLREKPRLGIVGQKEADPPVTPPSASSLAWRTDAYESVKCLWGMYINELAPFSEWHDLNAPLLPQLEEMAGTNVKGYQLWLWFDIYRRRRGAIESRMLQDAFCDLFNPGSDQINWLLDFQAKGVRFVAEMPSEKKASVEKAFGCKMPIEFYLPMHQLLSFPDSPYAEGKHEMPDAQHHALTLCLVKGAVAANELFTPMLDAIQNFDASRIPSWKWLDALGAHERHLRRRQNNPLFAAERHLVTVSEVYEARILDAKAHDAALDELRQIRNELRDTDVSHNWYDFLKKMHKRVRAAQHRIASMDRCGDELKPFAEKLLAFVRDCMREWISENNPEGLASLEEAQKIDAQYDATFSSDWICQISDIPSAERTASLLTDPVSSLTAIVRTLESSSGLREVLVIARPEALDLVRKARSEGHQLPGIEEKLKILGAVL
jgi:hypothetical protein